MPIEPTESISCTSYNNFDGTNYTLVNSELSYKKDNFSFGGAAGIGTDFKKSTDLVIDFKGSHQYYKGEKVKLSHNLRIRSKLNEDTQSVQFRYSPLTINVPLAKGVDGYANLNYCGLLKSDGTYKNSGSVFFGTDININKNLKISPELQHYNIQDIKDIGSRKNLGFNLSAKYSF